MIKEVIKTHLLYSVYNEQLYDLFFLPLSKLLLVRYTLLNLGCDLRFDKFWSTKKMWERIKAKLFNIHFCYENALGLDAITIECKRPCE